MGSFDYLLHDITDNTANTWQPASERSRNVSNVSIVTHPLSGEFEERAAISQFDASIPKEWAEGFARFQHSSPLPGFSPESWQTLLDDGGRFLDRWAAKAIGLNWTVEDCFGVDPRAPGARLDQMGLVPLICGTEIIAITEDSAKAPTPG